MRYLYLINYCLFQFVIFNLCYNKCLNYQLELSQPDGVVSLKLNDMEAQSTESAFDKFHSEITIGSASSGLFGCIAPKGTFTLSLFSARLMTVTEKFCLPIRSTMVVDQ